MGMTISWFSSVVNHIPGIHQVQKNKYFPSAQLSIKDLHFTLLPTKATQIRLASLMMQSPPLLCRQTHPPQALLPYSVSYSNMYHAAFQNSFLLGCIVSSGVSRFLWDISLLFAVAIRSKSKLTQYTRKHLVNWNVRLNMDWMESLVLQWRNLFICCFLHVVNTELVCSRDLW